MRQPVVPPNIDCARAMRDAGIDAMAALDSAVAEAIAGLSDEQAREVKVAFGHAMSAVMDGLINPATRAFAELQADGATWGAVAKTRAALRAEK